MCASNLRQVNVGWQGYLQDHKEQFPRYDLEPDWRYGGVAFLSVAGQSRTYLDAARPINPYLMSDLRNDAGLYPNQGSNPGGTGPGASAPFISSDLVGIFRCPADTGVARRGTGTRGHAGVSVLNGQSCYQYYGNSYRANVKLLDSSPQNPWGDHHPLALHDVTVDTSRLLLAGDAAWYYANPAANGGARSDADLEASWHPSRDSGNMLATDGSVKFLDFSKRPHGEFTLSPVAGGGE